jgi:hypothetical protein
MSTLILFVLFRPLTGKAVNPEIEAAVIGVVDERCCYWRRRRPGVSPLLRNGRRTVDVDRPPDSERISQGIAHFGEGVDVGDGQPHVGSSNVEQQRVTSIRADSGLGDRSGDVPAGQNALGDRGKPALRVIPCDNDRHGERLQRSNGFTAALPPQFRG